MMQDSTRDFVAAFSGPQKLPEISKGNPLAPGGFYSGPLCAQARQRLDVSSHHFSELEISRRHSSGARAPSPEAGDF